MVERYKLNTNSRCFKKRPPTVNINLTQENSKIAEPVPKINLLKAPETKHGLVIPRLKMERVWKTSRDFHPKVPKSARANVPSYFDKASQGSKTKRCKEMKIKFPNGGWVCSSCQNYNFHGRKRCNRCKKDKACTDFNGKPLHLLKAEGKLPKHFPTQGLGLPNSSHSRNGEASVLAYTEAGKQELEVIKSARSCQLDLEKSISSLSTKKLVEKKGDWTCKKCHNLNFAFRKRCNRCKHPMQKGKK